MNLPVQILNKIEAIPILIRTELIQEVRKITTGATNLGCGNMKVVHRDKQLVHKYKLNHRANLTSTEVGQHTIEALRLIDHPEVAEEVEVPDQAEEGKDNI